VNASEKRRDWLALALLVLVATLTAWRFHDETTTSLVVSSVLMFGCCWVNATHLLGARLAAAFVLWACCFGWFAEQMGSSLGWFFGSYTYTDVLGPRLLNVPVVIPMMWFVLSYIGFVIANFITWQNPLGPGKGVAYTVVLSLLAAMVVTAFDLGADPYFVYALKAWIMTKTDGGWFGETLQGFVGWITVAFVIVLGLHLMARKTPPPQSTFTKRSALLPLGIYGCALVFQMFKGTPVEVRAIAPFAMGIPLLSAMVGWWRWECPDARL
jgi:putative membrane protein